MRYLRALLSPREAGRDNREVVGARVMPRSLAASKTMVAAAACVCLSEKYGTRPSFQSSTP